MLDKALSSENDFVPRSRHDMSNTWSSADDLAFEYEDKEDRGLFVDEYNRLARQVGFCYTYKRVKLIYNSSIMFQLLCHNVLRSLM